MLEVNDTGMVVVITYVVDVDPPLQLTVEAKSKVPMAIPSPQIDGVDKIKDANAYPML